MMNHADVHRSYVSIYKKLTGTCSLSFFHYQFYFNFHVGMGLPTAESIGLA